MFLMKLAFFRDFDSDPASVAVRFLVAGGVFAQDITDFAITVQVVAFEVFAEFRASFH